MSNKERKVLLVEGSGLTIGYKMLDALQEAFAQGYRAPNNTEQQIPNRPVVTPRQARFVLFKDLDGEQPEKVEQEVEQQEEEVVTESVEDDEQSEAGVTADNTKKEILAYAKENGIEVDPTSNKAELLEAINGV